MPSDRSKPALILPCPLVAFDAGFVARIERFSARIAAARERRAGFGTRAGAEGGHEFVGYRAYQAGDDPRRIDWNALARLGRVLVRVTRREAGEVWLVVVDASASMGAGPPGKLQRAAECAAALCALALRSGAHARIVAMPGAEGRDRVVDVDRRAKLGEGLAFLEELTAEGRATGSDIARAVSVGREAARLFVISDLTSFEPPDLIRAASARRRASAIRILAPHELGIASSGRVEWVDPEDGARLDVELDAATLGRYEVELGRELERWRSACARARVTHTVDSSTAPFEDILARTFAP